MICSDRLYLMTTGDSTREERETKTSYEAQTDKTEKKREAKT